MSSVSAFPTIQTVSFKRGSHSLIIPAGIGVALLVGGIFVLLASHRILPQGVNVISRLAVWGQVAGYGGISLGFLIPVVAIVKRTPFKPIKEKHPPPEEKKATSSLTGLLTPTPFPRARLPIIYGISTLSQGIEMWVRQEGIQIEGRRGYFGVVAQQEICVREMAYLLQEYAVLVEGVMKFNQSNKAVKKLGKAIRSQLPHDRIAALCFVNKVHKNYSIEVFGRAHVDSKVYGKNSSFKQISITIDRNENGNDPAKVIRYHGPLGETISIEIKARGGKEVLYFPCFYTKNSG